MTTCALVLGIITCTSTAPKLTPAEAVRVFTAASTPSMYVPPAPLYGPVVATTGSRPGASPWDWPKPRPARRLDGTLLTTPPTIYGLPPWWAFRHYPPHSYQRRSVRKFSGESH